MRRLLITIFLPVMLLSTLFAVEKDIEVELYGEVVTTYAYNFDLFFHGLDTAAKAGLKLKLNNEEGYETDSYSNFFGYIKIDNMGLFQFRTPAYTSASPGAQAWETGSPLYNITTSPVNGLGTEIFNPEIEAKLYLGPVYLKFDNNIALSADRDMDLEKMKYLTVEGHDVNDLNSAQLSDPSGVLALGYENKMLSVDLRICSQLPGRILDGNTELLNRASGFAFGSEFTITPIKGLAIDMGLFGSINYIDLTPPTITYYEGMAPFILVETGETEYLLVTGYTEDPVDTYGNFTDNPLMGGLEASYTIPVKENLDLIPFLGIEAVQHLDYSLLDSDPANPAVFTDSVNTMWQNGDLEFEIGAGVDLVYPTKLNWENKADEDLTVQMGSEFSEWTGVAIPYSASQGATLYIGYLASLAELKALAAITEPTVEQLATLSGELNLKLTGFDGLGEDSLIPYVGIGLVGIINNLLDPVHLNFGAGLFVNTDVLENFIPFIHANTWFNYSNIATEYSGYVDFALGFETSLLENTLLSFKYQTGNLLTPVPVDAYGNKITTNYYEKWGHVMTQVKISYN